MASRDRLQALAAGAVTEAQKLAAELAERGGWDPAAVTVKADSPETLAVVYADHEFRIGSGNYDEKLKRLGEIFADMRQRGRGVFLRGTAARTPGRGDGGKKHESRR